MFQRKKNFDKNNIDSYINGSHDLVPRQDALLVAGIYCLFGLLWIGFSDRLLLIFADNLAFYQDMQTYKGWLFILVTTILVYLLVLHRASLFLQAISRLGNSYEQLQAAYEELVATEDELRYQKEFIENVIREAPVVIGIFDEQGKIKSSNPYGQNLLGYSDDEILKQDWFSMAAPSDHAGMSAEDSFREVKNGHGIMGYENRHSDKGDNPLDILWSSSRINAGGSLEILSVGIDITQRKELERKLWNLAYYDVLTGLPNRAMLEEKAVDVIRSGSPFALVYMDIDNFKFINDTLGHIVGDQFLRYFSARLQDAMQAEEECARISGDEFAIILKGDNDRAAIEQRLSEIIKGVGNTWEIKHHEFFISLSIGIALYPEHGDDFTMLFKNADVSMYRAKTEGKGKWLFYTGEIAESNAKNIQLARELQSAIENQGLTLFYQPQISLVSGKMTGMEALIRWEHPLKGFIPPSDFIPLSEYTGQIYDIEKWVFRTAIAEKEKLADMGFSELKMSINLSSKSLTSDINFHELEKLLASYGKDCSNIVIEITETAVISDVDFAIKRLDALKEAGVRIALDDFGTGYSSLSYLKSLPIDIIKLDQNFIKSIEKGSKESIIVKSVLSLSRDLGYEVVAEGIETESQLEYLKKHQCDTGQGYLFSKAVPAIQIENMLQGQYSLRNLF